MCRAGGIRDTVLRLSWALALCLFGQGRAQEQSHLTPSVVADLRRDAHLTADPCDDSGNEVFGERDESGLFEGIATETLAAFNSDLPRDQDAKGRANVFLTEVESQSATFNRSWPDENRFHFSVLDQASLIVVKMSFRTHQRFFVFGVPDKFEGQANQLWREVGSDSIWLEHPAPRTWLTLYALHRGVSGRVRFLASLGYTGCAGSSGLSYEVNDWDSSGSGVLNRTLMVEGSIGMDESFEGKVPTAKEPFVPVGRLVTGGAVMALPYCWFSAIDTWDNPSLCAVDRFDLSRDEPRFMGRNYNRPDLVPIAKALEYGGKHDFPAVLGYCGSAAMAWRIVQDGGGGYGAEEVIVTRIGREKERVRLGADGPRFEVEKRGGRWVIMGFRPR